MGGTTFSSHISVHIVRQDAPGLRPTRSMRARSHRWQPHRTEGSHRHLCCSLCCLVPFSGYGAHSEPCSALPLSRSSVHKVYWPGATPRLLTATPHLFSSLRSAGHSPSLSLSPSSHAYISYHHHQCVPFYHHHLRLTTREQWAKNRLRLCHFRCRQRWKFSNSWLYMYYTSNAVFFCLTCIM